MAAGSEDGDGVAEDSNPLEVLPSFKLDLQRPVVLGGAAGARAGPTPPSHMLASPSKAARASSTGRAELSRTVHFAQIQMIFSAREDGTVAFWDVHSERARAEVHHLKAHKVRGSLTAGSGCYRRVYVCIGHGPTRGSQATPHVSIWGVDLHLLLGPETDLSGDGIPGWLPCRAQ
jgi:hypothetical protein